MKGRSSLLTAGCTACTGKTRLPLSRPPTWAERTESNATSRKRGTANTSLFTTLLLRPGSPSLDSMLASLPRGAFLNLELKADTLLPSDCAPIYEALQRRATPGPVLVSSFEPALLPYFKSRDIPIGLLIGEEAAKMGMAGMAREIWRLKPDYLNLPILMFEMLGRRRALLLTRAMRALGFSLAFWTVNSLEEAAMVAKLARIIITDEVESIRGMV